jgi:hypothetical protein
MAMSKRTAVRSTLILLIAFLVFYPTITVAMGGSIQAFALTPKRRDSYYRLHTDGKWIKDNQGNIVILRGAAVFQRWMWAESWVNFDPLGYVDENQEKYDLYASSGANFLRVQLNKWLWDNANPTYTRAIDTLLTWCKQRRIMVVLTFQTYDIYNYTSGAYVTWTKEQRVDYVVNGTMRDFMSTLASRYKSQPNVIGFEIMPERPRDTFWAAYREITPEQARSEYRNGLISAIRAIHDVSSDYLVFVYPSSDDELGRFVFEAPISEPNVVYCEMRYVSWDKGWRAYADAYYSGDPRAYTLLEQEYQSLLFDVVDQGYPVLLMETGTHGDLPALTTYLNDLHTMFKKHQVGICWWTFEREPVFGYVVLLQGRQDSKSTLTQFGLVWAQQMKGWNLAPAA